MTESERVFHRRGNQFPFNGRYGYDLKSRVSISDVTGDQSTVLFLLQDHYYLDASYDPDDPVRGLGYTLERQAGPWLQSALALDLPEGTAIEADQVIVRNPHPHADVLILLRDWVGSGIAGVILAELWRHVRQGREVPVQCRNTGGAPLDIAFARWVVAAQFLDPGVDSFDWFPEGDLALALTLVNETYHGDGRFQYTFRSKTGAHYAIELRTLEDAPFAVVASISRTRPSEGDAVRAQDASLANYWPDRIRDSRYDTGW